MIPTIPFFQELLKYLKQYFQKIRKNFDQFSVNSPTTLQNIQLSFIYFFAFVDLLINKYNLNVECSFVGKFIASKDDPINKNINGFIKI